MISSPVFCEAFVGRKEELAFLQEELEAARERGPRLLPVKGEAGIGKSRLIRQFDSLVSERVRFVIGECPEHIELPYFPFRTILRKLGETAHTEQEKPFNLRRASGQRAEFFLRVGQIFERESRSRPLVCVIEDAHWADAATLELLQFLWRNLVDARILFIVTLRQDEAQRHPRASALLANVARSRSHAIELRGLRRHEIRTLVGQTLLERGLRLNAETTTQIERLCEGSPLFAEELIRLAAENGGRIALRPEAMPLSLQAMLAERLADFSESDNDLLVRAAVIGKQFDAHFLASIANVPVERINDLLQRAVNQRLVTELPGKNYSYVFRHALIREALADRLLIGVAAPLHLRIAKEIESAPDAAFRSAELAHHFAAAQVAGSARRYAQKAAEEAAAMYAYGDAVYWYDTALHWDYPTGAGRAEVNERLGTLLYLDGRGEEPQSYFKSCYSEYEALGDRDGMAHALLRLADQYWVDAQTRRSLAAASAASRLLKEPGNALARARAQLSRARFAITLGKIEIAQKCISTANAPTESDDREHWAMFHEVRAEIRAAKREAQGAFEDILRATRYAAESALGDLISQVENNAAIAAADLGDLFAAMQHHRTAVSQARRTSLPWRYSYSALNFAQTLMLAGKLEEAHRLVSEALDCGVDTATFKTKAASVGIPLSLMLNDRVMLKACSDVRAITLAYQSGELQRISAVTIAFVELRQAQGMKHDAQVLLRRALDYTRGVHRNRQLFLAGACHGDATVRHRSYRLSRLITGTGNHTDDAFATAVAAACSDDDGAGRQDAVEAATMFASLGWLLHSAAATELAGDVAAARAGYEQIGSLRDVARLRSTMAAPLRDEVRALTVRQLEIARLIGLGLTNRAIASSLHISEHTVEHHLSAIFERLKLRSRSQVAVWAAQSGTASSA